MLLTSVRFQFALLLALTTACSSYTPNKTTTGAVAGGALGAGLGAIVGNQTGDAGAGIAIGAAAGTLAGGLLGNTFDSRDAEMQAQRETIERQNELIEENRRLIEELRRRGADVRSDRRGVVINLPDILFEFDRANLTPEADRTIGEIGSVLSEVRGRPISVEGHTDSIGTVAYNQRLSDRRARSVAAELERNGVRRTQMTVRGFGEGSPIATNNTDAGRARNRRVEVIIEN